MLLACLLAGGCPNTPYLNTWADEDTEAWPDDIDYPPAAFRYMPPQPAPQIVTPPVAGAEKPAKKKHRWPLLGRKKDPLRKVPAKSEEEIVNVGPRELPNAREPLLTLPVALYNEANGTVILPGFYLLRPDTSETGGSARFMSLIQRNKVIYHFAVTQSESLPTDSSPSPLTATDPKQPPPQRNKIETTLSPDRQTLTITVYDGTHAYRSPPLPTALDLRPTLRH